MDKNESVFQDESKESFDAAVLNAVMGVPGVAKVTKCATTSRKCSSSCLDEPGYDLELGLAIEYGSSIPEIHENIQKKIREDIEAAADFEVKKINLCIEDICHVPKDVICE